MTQRLLVVTEDELLATVVSVFFEKRGFEVALTGDAGDSLPGACERPPCTAIVDGAMAHLDACAICRQLKAMLACPILVLRARFGPGDAQRVCEAGADDCLRKPFGLHELDSRVRALCQQSDGVEQRAALELRCGRLQLNLRSHSITLDGTPVALTPAEFRLLSYMMRNRGRLLTYDDLLSHVWGDRFSGERDFLDACVRYLRRRLDDDGREPRFIAPVRGDGYCFL